MDNKEHRQEQEAWPGIPSSVAHRASMKWMTLESVRIIQQRLAQRDVPSKVLFLTSSGYIQGFLGDILEHYEDAVSADKAEQIDIASAAAHVRTELMGLYSKRDPAFAPIDNGAIIHVHDAVMKLGGRKLRIPHLALFSSEILGFTLTTTDVL